jgi:hypothetical protein
MENEKELILNELMSKIKEVAENTNFAYPTNNLYVTEQIQNLYKEKFPNFDWTYNEETGVLEGRPVVTMFPIDIIVSRKEDNNES